MNGQIRFNTALYKVMMVKKTFFNLKSIQLQY